MCEEIGHSVGLAHSDENASCMSQQWSKTNLTIHDKTHLNNIYSSAPEAYDPIEEQAATE